MVLRKNEIVKGKITDLNDDGQGVLKIDDNIIFVPNTIPGEEIEAIIIKSFTKYSIAKLTNFIKTSDERVVPPCPYYNKCGGCDIMHLPESSQVEFKTKKVQKALKRIANISFNVSPFVNLLFFEFVFIYFL